MADRTASMSVDVDPSPGEVPAAREHVARVLATGPAGFVLLTMLAAAVICWPAAVALHELWTDTQSRSYTHGYLILLIALWLICRDAPGLASTRVRPVRPALAGVVVLSAAWLVSWRAGLQDLHLVMLPPLVLLELLTVFGWSVVLRVAFPVAFLYFALPLWSSLVGILQRMSVEATGVLIWCTGLPAYVEGDRVHVPAGVLHIEDGCSGLHFLIVGLAMAALYGELLKDSMRLRIRWLLLMGALAIVCNWLRIFVIVVAGYVTDMRGFLITVDHYWFGWLMFAAAFAIFLTIANRTTAGRTRAALRNDQLRGESRVGEVRWYATVVACSAVLPVSVYARDLLRSPLVPNVIAWRRAPQNWLGPRDKLSSSWSPEFHNATESGLREYTSSKGQWVQVFAVAYRTQEQGRELVAYDNDLLGAAGGLRALDARVVSAGASRWRETRVTDDGGNDSIIWSQYRIGARSFVVPVVSQLWYGVTALGAPPASSLVAMRTPCEHNGCDDARERLHSRVADLVPTLRVQGRGDSP